MKILSQHQIRETDAQTIQKEPISSIDLMERAANRFVKRFLKDFKKVKKIHIFCGKGNNGGDGLVAARMLMQKGCHIKTYIVHYSKEASEDFNTNLERLIKLEHSEIVNITDIDHFPRIKKNEIIIDALWGTGLSRPVSGFSREIILKINSSGAKIVAMDIPSGLFCDEFNADKAIVKADLTITFQTPKLSFFMPENQTYCGDWSVVDIGLDKDFIKKQEVKYNLTDKSEIRRILKVRDAFDHKGHFGHALLIAGSTGKMGAAVLAAKACMRSGAGLVTVHIPADGKIIMQTAVPEVMVTLDSDPGIFTRLPDLKQYTVIGIGPGIGIDAKTCIVFEELLQKCEVPLVIDADAINILARKKELLTILPKHTILTPHIGEFERLVGKCENHYERLAKLSEFARKHKCIVILKGKYSAIAAPDGTIYFNPTGNPGMATGGSGDVLTGIVTGIKAQHQDVLEAVKIATFVHGQAGDLAVRKTGQTSMIAGDLIDFLPKSIKKFLR